jgi:5-hydroxyisourate hydrolase
MATLSTHTLNSVDGTHAGHVGISLSQIGPDGLRTPIFSKATDAVGRLSERIEIATADASAEYELVFQTGAYFARQGLPILGMRIMNTVVLRFNMPDPEATYHMPLMIAPNSYSAWWSS